MCSQISTGSRNHGRILVFGWTFLHVVVLCVDLATLGNTEPPDGPRTWLRRPFLVQATGRDRWCLRWWMEKSRMGLLIDFYEDTEPLGVAKHHVCGVARCRAGELHHPTAVEDSMGPPVYHNAFGTARAHIVVLQEHERTGRDRWCLRWWMEKSRMGLLIDFYEDTEPLGVAKHHVCGVARCRAGELHHPTAVEDSMSFRRREFPFVVPGARSFRRREFPFGGGGPACWNMRWGICSRVHSTEINLSLFLMTCSTMQSGSSGPSSLRNRQSIAWAVGEACNDLK